MWECIKDILTAREPGEGYFGGAEGAIRFVLFFFIFGIGAVLWFVFR
jgi:hypothetical protein